MGTTAATIGACGAGVDVCTGADNTPKGRWGYNNDLSQLDFNQEGCDPRAAISGPGVFNSDARVACNVGEMMHKLGNIQENVARESVRAMSHGTAPSLSFIEEQRQATGDALAGGFREEKHIRGDGEKKKGTPLETGKPMGQVRKRKINATNSDIGQSHTDWRMTPQGVEKNS